MIIEKNVCSIATIAAKETSRYAITGARFRRIDGGRCQADATDGRMLLRLEWSDDAYRKASPIPAGMCSADVRDSADGFETILSTDHIKRIGKAIPKRGNDPWKRAILSEHDVNGRAQFHMADGSAVIDAETIAGRFPDADAVIPALNTGAGLTHSKAGASVTIGVNPEFLERICKAIRTAACDDDNKAVRLTIPVNGDSPMLVTSRPTSTGIEATGVVMPVRLPDQPKSNSGPTYYDTLRNCAALTRRIAAELDSKRIKLEPVKAENACHRARCRELSDLLSEALEALEALQPKSSLAE